MFSSASNWIWDSSSSASGIRNRENAYRYLAESVLRFPDYEALTEKLRSHGLIDVKYEPFTLGIATLYVGVKPPRP